VLGGQIFKDYLNVRGTGKEVHPIFRGKEEGTIDSHKRKGGSRKFYVNLPTRRAWRRSAVAAGKKGKRILKPTLSRMKNLADLNRDRKKQLAAEGVKAGGGCKKKVSTL